MMFGDIMVAQYSCPIKSANVIDKVVYCLNAQGRTSFHIIGPNV